MIADKVQKLIVLIIMLALPPSLFLLVSPIISDIQITAPELAYIPSFTSAMLILIGVLDSFGMIKLTVDWWPEIFS